MSKNVEFFSDIIFLFMLLFIVNNRLDKYSSFEAFEFY